jgi:hypothetical protein
MILPNKLDILKLDTNLNARASELRLEKMNLQAALG